LVNFIGFDFDEGIVVDNRPFVLSNLPEYLQKSLHSVWNSPPNRLAPS
jgi:hypothetical protein